MVSGDDFETLAGDAGDSLQALGMQQGWGFSLRRAVQAQS